MTSNNTPDPLAEQQLDEIETRAAHLYEYGDPTDTRTAGWEELARTDVPALLAEVRRLRVERDAFRDQRNRVFETNQRLIAEVHESDQARLRAENETRTALRSTAVEGAQR